MKLKILEINNIKLLVISILSFTCITSPFWHIYFEKGAGDGVFGFKSMRSFLYTFGTHFILFGCSIFLLMVINTAIENNKQLKYIGNLIGGAFCSVSIYYLLFIFVDTNIPYPDYVYELAFVFTSILSSIFMIMIFRFQFKIKNKRIREQKESKEFIDTALNFIDEMNQSIVR